MSYFEDTAGTNFSHPTQNADQTPEERNDGSAGNTLDSEASPYDFLSFLAIVSLSTAPTAWTAQMLNEIHITPSNIRLSEKRRHGSFFSVSLGTKSLFSKILPSGIADLELPRLIAVKTPILDPNPMAQRNRQIFDSMTKEYQILNYEALKKNKNITSLIGCCWRTIDIHTKLVVPNLLLEGADLGDLEDFYRRNYNTITMRRRLGLSIDVASGVEALHSVGILHGDIKPRNILVFQDKECGYIAKIADFGSSLSLRDTRFPRRHHGGTPLFSAPELLDSTAEFDEDELLRAEIYSLGIVLLFLLKGPSVLDKLLSIEKADLKERKIQGGLYDWTDQDAEQSISTVMTRKTFGESAAKQEIRRRNMAWFDTQQLRMLRRSQPDGKGKIDAGYLEADGDWITLKNDTLKSQAGEQLFRDFVDQMTSGEPTKRPTNTYQVLQTLRHILRLELRVVYDSNQHQKRRDEERMASMWRRFNRRSIHAYSATPTLNRQETTAIILDYFLNEKSHTNFFRELLFLWKFGSIAKFSRQHCSPSNSSKPRVKAPISKVALRSSNLRKNIVENFMFDTFITWLRQRKQVQKYQIHKFDGNIFRASRNEKYTTLLPYGVRNELLRQFKYIADSPKQDKIRRATASFEYAIMILCFPAISEVDSSLLPGALHYLHLSATLGHHEAQSMAGTFYDSFAIRTPISLEEETEQLLHASLKGSMTAMRRLRKLNPSRYIEARRLISFEYNGSFVKGEPLPETDAVITSITNDLMDVPPTFIHKLAAHGQLERLWRLSYLPVQYFDDRNGFGETPIVVACRCGHTDILTLLLALGADPSIGTDHGVHPLHFLSAFNDDDIPQVAATLVKYGAALEPHSRAGRVYSQGVDGRFGVEEGTPLLWAVITGNIVAVRSLLKLGADIFSYRKLEKWQFHNSQFIWSSPIEYAIETFQYDILEVLLSSCTDSEKAMNQLNELRRVGRDVMATPLLYALHRRLYGHLKTTLLHGCHVKQAQLRTVKTLLQYGANPLQLSRETRGHSINPILVVCQSNNLLLLQFLWNHDDGNLRPSSPRQFFECVTHAMESSSRDIFDFLIAQYSDIAAADDTHNWDRHALARACEITDDSHYVSSLMTLISRRVSLSSPPLTTPTNSIVINSSKEITFEYDPFKEWITPIKGRAVLQQTKGNVEIGEAFGLLIRRDLIGTSFYEKMEPPSQETMKLAIDIFDRYGRLKEEYVTHATRKGLGIWQKELSTGNFFIVETVTVKKKFRNQGIGKKLVKDILLKAASLDENMRFAFAFPTCLHAGEDLEERAGKTKRVRFEMAQAQTITAIDFFRALGFRRIGMSDWFAFSYQNANHPSFSISAKEDPDLPEIECFDSDYDSDDSRPEIPKTSTLFVGPSIEKDGNLNFDAISPSAMTNLTTTYFNNKRKRQNGPGRFERDYPIHYALQTHSDAQCLELLTEKGRDDAFRQHLSKMKDNEGNNILHTAATYFKPDCVAWILKVFLDTDCRDLKLDRNVHGHTPFDALKSKLEETRLLRYHGTRFFFQGDKFDGYDEKAVSCVLLLCGWAVTDLNRRNQARFGCTCGLCIGGFLSHRMCQALRWRAETIVQTLTETDEVANNNTWYMLNEHLLQHTPRNVQMVFKRSRVLRKGFRAFFTTLIKCLHAGVVPTTTNLMEIYRKDGPWPQMERLYFDQNGSIEAAINVVLDLEKRLFSKSGVDLYEQRDTSLPMLPLCRNDYEFEVVRRQCTNIVHQNTSSENSFNELMSLQTPWLPYMMKMMEKLI